MGDKKVSEIESLKTEIVGLKVRVRRIEDYLRDLPHPDNYVNKPNYISGGIDDEPLIGQAVETVSKYDRVSASLLQRSLAIGYARAARLLDMLEKAEIVGTVVGSKPREVLHNNIKKYLKEGK